ncbi:lipocalin family protein [Flavobacterium sp.]|uniref:lipocalin family protein n=2 Tax=Flavobacterium sp. TaxID=239 RepID=UPI0040349520
MKKISMVAFAATALMAMSCSDDDSSNSVALSGKWKLTKITTDQAFDGNEDGTATKDLIAETGQCWKDTYFEFLANNEAINFISTPWLGNECYTAETEGSYAVDGNSVVVTAMDEEGESSELELTKTGNKLKTYVPDFYEVEVTVGGETQVVSVAATLEFTKQ